MREGTGIGLSNFICAFLQAHNVRAGNHAKSSLHSVGVEQTSVPYILIFRFNVLHRFSFVRRIGCM